MKGTWQHDSQIKVERYADYKGTKPKIGGATFKIYQQDTAEYADLLPTTVDVMKTDPDREPVHGRVRPGRPLQAQPGVDVPVPRLPDVRPGLRQPGRAQGDLDGDRP